jgi:2-iminobutanoate/2-iminopropanoate deaminase
VNAYLADIGDWDEFNAAYKSSFEPPYPTRTTVGAGLHGVLVEVTAVARA